MTFNFFKLWKRFRLGEVTFCLDIFFCLYRGRYTELLSPLIVNAQHQLVKRITEHGGTPTAQPHYVRAVNDDGVAVSTLADFIQLQRHVDKVSDQPPSDAPVASSTDPPQLSTAYSRIMTC